MSNKPNKEVLAALDAAGLRPSSAAVFYLQNTSEFKDDLPQLINTMKNDSSPTGQMARQEASFLLWYHSLADGGAHVPDLLTHGLIGACLQVLDSKVSRTPDRTCATGILMTLCTTDKVCGTGACDQLIRSKALTSTAVQILHDLLQESGDNMRGYAARCLQCIAEDVQARTSLMKVMDGLPYLSLYKAVVTQSVNTLAANSVTAFLVAMLKGQPELVRSAVAGGLIKTVIHGLQHHKIDNLVHHCADLLAILMECQGARDEAVSLGGLGLLVDLLGPPPESITKYESEHFGHILNPEMFQRRQMEARRKAEEAQAVEDDKAQQHSDGQNADQRVSGIQKKFTAWGQPVKANAQPMQKSPSALKLQRIGSSDENSKPDKHKGVKIMVPGGSKHEAVPDSLLSPVKSLDQLLSHNKAALQWSAFVSSQMRGTVAGCLYTLAQSTDHMHAISALFATSRLVPLIPAILYPPEQGKKKKPKSPSKGKKLKLSPEDTTSLINITGALKFLTLIGANCYRVARLGALKHLVTLYKEATHTLLRRNAQVILANVSAIAECGQMLYDAKLPEVFLVAVPVRLTPAEVSSLLQEFPDAPLGQNQAS